ncbi:hypothetical protein NFI96_008802 [Prochilodus magdalenae]|nr:hypothetical protein NFI96_008802 [Prochilodus magdalenae]
MPPKANKAPSSTQPLIRPMVQATSSPVRDATPSGEARASSAVTLDTAALKSELVTAVVAELQTALKEHHSKIQAELQEMKSELTRDFASMRSELAGIKTTVSEVEHSLSTCTDDMVALQAKVELLTKEITRLDTKCEDLEARSRRHNLRIVGIPEDDSYSLTTTSVSSLLKEAFSLDKCPLVDRAHRSLAPKPRSGEPPRPIIARLHYYGDCADILKIARRQQRVSASNMTFSVFPDFTAKVAKARAAFNGVRRRLREIEGIKYGIFYPARLRISRDGNFHDFTSPEEASRFVDTLTK